MVSIEEARRRIVEALNRVDSLLEQAYQVRSRASKVFREAIDSYLEWPDRYMVLNRPTWRERIDVARKLMTSEEGKRLLDEAARLFEEADRLTEEARMVFGMLPYDDLTFENLVLLITHILHIVGLIGDDKSK